MTNKPRNFYAVLNDFGAWFGEPPAPRIDLVPRPVSIDLSQFTAEQLRWMAEGEAEELARTESADAGRV